MEKKLIETARRNGGRYPVNIARPDRIDRAMVEAVEVFNSQIPKKVEQSAEAVATSEEMGTALPSVNIYIYIYIYVNWRGVLATIGPAESICSACGSPMVIGVHVAGTAKRGV